MITKVEIENKSLGIAFWQKDQDGDDDVIMVSGKCILNNNQLYLKCQEKRIIILDDWLSRIKKIEDPEIKKIFHESEFALSLSVADLPLNANMSEYESIGLNLNENNCD